MDDLPVTLTRYTSTSGDFSSTFVLNEDKKLMEILSPHVISPDRFIGTAQRIKISFDRFPQVLEKAANKGQALGYGLHLGTESLVDIVEDDPDDPDKTDPDDPDKTDASCTPEYFQYRSKPGVLMIECSSPEEYEPGLTPKLLMQMLTRIDPQLKTVARVTCDSSSSDNIFLIDENEKPIRAFKIYFPVKNAKDIPRYGQLLNDWLWLSGFGYVELSESGRMFLFSPINSKVFRPDYFDVVSHPNVDIDKYLFLIPIPEYKKGGYLDTTKLVDLTQREKEKLDTLVLDEKMKLKSQSEKNKIAWKNKMIEKMTDKYIGPENIVSILNDMLNDERRLIDKNVKLDLPTRTLSILHIDRNSSTYDGEALADPIEGCLNNKYTARLWKNGGLPIIQSLVHGERFTYHLSAFYFKEKSIHYTENIYRMVMKFNETHANVMIGDKNRIMRIEPGTSFSEGRITYSFFARGELSKVYDNKKIKTYATFIGSEKYENILLAWVKHPLARTYTGGVIFLPGKKAGEGYFNTWSGFSVEPKENHKLLNRVYKHIEHVICKGNSELYDYFIRWTAYTIQNPDKPAGVAIVLRGEKGTGKSIIGHFLRKIWGNHGLYITSPKYLVGPFNGHLADTCFLFSDEAFFVGDKANENILKGLITEPMMTIERKGLNMTQQPNYLKILMVTNSDYVVPVSRDERRYCVFDVSDLRRERNDENIKYFDALNKSLNSEKVQSAFLYDMQNFDLTGWDIRDIPESSGLRAQRYYSMNSVQHWFADVLNKGSFNTLGSYEFGIDCFEQITSAQLYKSYLEWFNAAENSDYKKVSKSVMGEYFGKIFKRVKVVPLTKTSRGYDFGGLENAKKRFQEYEKIDLSELESFDDE